MCRGQNSLSLYRLSILLAIASQMALLDTSHGLAMQIVLSLGGIVAMIASATLLSLIGIHDIFHMGGNHGRNTSPSTRVAQFRSRECRTAGSQCW